MDAHRINVLKNTINHWDIDIENGKIITPRGTNGSIDGSGRLVSSVAYKGKRYTFYVHLIIAFAGGLDLLNKDVNHIDGDKMNNKFSNLEAITREENFKHQKENRLREYGSKHHHTKLTENDVLKIRELHEKGTKQTDLSRMFNVHISGINRIVKRENWTHI